KFHGFGLPTLVEQNSREWRVPADLSKQAVLIRRIGSRHLDSWSHRRRREGSYFETVVQDFPTSLMNHPGLCSDLFVIVWGDIFHEKIHEAAFLLEQTNERHNFCCGLVRGRRRRLGGDRSSRRRGSFPRGAKKAK